MAEAGGFCFGRPQEYVLSLLIRVLFPSCSQSANHALIGRMKPFSDDRLKALLREALNIRVPSIRRELMDGDVEILARSVLERFKVASLHVFRNVPPSDAD